MNYVRMILWVLLLVALVIFSVNNWAPVEVKIWENLILETKIPALVVLSFLLGLVPMWLVHRGVRWRLERRISGLESAQRAATVQTAAREAAPGGLDPAPASTRSPDETL